MNRAASRRSRLRDVVFIAGSQAQRVSCCWRRACPRGRRRSRKCRRRRTARVSVRRVEEMPSAADSVGVSSNNSSGSGDAPSPEIEGGGWFSGVGFSFSGFSRIETAIRMTGEENPFNQRGNLFNGVPTARCGGVPPTPVCISPDVATRNGQKANNPVSTCSSSARTSISRPPSTKTGPPRALVRGIYELGEYDNFSRDAVGSNADGYLYGKPNFFEYDNYRKGGCQNRLEVCGRNYMVDLPNFTVDYQNGPLLIRAGNQQIAWGQALFLPRARRTQRPRPASPPVPRLHARGIRRRTHFPRRPSAPRTRSTTSGKRTATCRCSSRRSTRTRTRHTT